MSLLGIHLTLLIGPLVPLPAPPPLTEALERVEVTHSDEGRSGFQLTFKAGRGLPYNPVDYPLLMSPFLRPFNRVILVVTFNVMPRVLMDGIITDQQFAPSNDPGGSSLTVTGEDVSLMMDLKEIVMEHPAQSELVIANKIIASYAAYGLLPTVVPPPSLDVPLPTERVPVQHGTDLAYLQEMAARYGYAFYIMPGPAPGGNIAYWGPRLRPSPPQSALTVGMGGAANVDSINFRYDSLAPQRTMGLVQDSRINQTMPIMAPTSTHPPLARQPASLDPRTRLAWPKQTAGLTATQAMARAQGETDSAAEEVLVAEGELDADRYGHLLWARRLVGVRGVGDTYGGLYYVKKVTHKLDVIAGSYKQSFVLNRQGTGSLSPVLVP